MNLSQITKLNWCSSIRVVTVDNEMLEGKLVGYTPAMDNEPERESILLEDSTGRLIELFEDEIKSVDTLVQ